jgi:hypothetical protein
MSSPLHTPTAARNVFVRGAGAEILAGFWQSRTPSFPHGVWTTAPFVAALRVVFLFPEQDADWDVVDSNQRSLPRDQTPLPLGTYFLVDGHRQPCDFPANSEAAPARHVSQPPAASSAGCKDDFPSLVKASDGACVVTQRSYRPRTGSGAVVAAHIVPLTNPAAILFAALPSILMLVRLMAPYERLIDSVPYAPYAPAAQQRAKRHHLARRPARRLCAPLIH